MTQQVFVGVDVAKDWLDIHHPSRGAARIDNTLAAARSFAARCAKEGGSVSEATQTVTVVIPLSLKPRRGRKAMVTAGVLALERRQDVVLIEALTIGPGSFAPGQAINDCGSSHFGRRSC